jgi:hypothetical protein
LIKEPEEKKLPPLREFVTNLYAGRFPWIQNGICARLSCKLGKLPAKGGNYVSVKISIYFDGILSYKSAMTYFKEKFEAYLTSIDWTPYKAAIEAKIDSGLLYRVLAGKRNLTQGMISKLVSVRDLRLTPTMLKAWKALDDYSLEELKQAIHEAEGKTGAL